MWVFNAWKSMEISRPQERYWTTLRLGPKDWEELLRLFASTSVIVGSDLKMGFIKSWKIEIRFDRLKGAIELFKFYVRTVCLFSDGFMCNSFFICRWRSISALWSNDSKTCSLVRKQGPSSEFVERVSAAVSCMYQFSFRTLQGLFSSVSGRATHALLWFMISRIVLAFLHIHTPYTNFGLNVLTPKSD